MLTDFVVHRRSGGVVASIDADYLEHPDLSVPDGDPGGDAGGGAEPPTEDIPLDDVDGQPVSTRGEAREDDDEDDDDDAAQEYATEREKRLANALKKAKKRASKDRPYAQRLRELEKAGVTLDDLIYSHRNYSGITEAARKNPRLNALINGEAPDDAPREAKTPPAPAKEDTFQFDDSFEALGFDPKESTANKRLAEAIRNAAEANWRLDRLAARFEPIATSARNAEATLTRQQQASVDREWNTATEAALSMVKDAGVRTLLSDALLFARKEPNAQRMGPKALIKHYLDKLEAGGHITAREAKSAATAAASATTTAQRTTARIATHVTQLPRQNPAGTPAPARNARESLADVRKRLTRSH